MPADKLPGLTETLRVVADVPSVPLVGLTDSQEALLPAVKPSDPLLSWAERLCAFGTTDPLK